jgi:GAF domain-containing protein
VHADRPDGDEECCEVAASAFGVAGAFIARVEEYHVSIEHSVGVRKMYPHDQFLRHETLCDFVLVQPDHHPLVILDCMIDPRTHDIPMVQQLGMRFFVGICIMVRGLPIGCLCAFDQESSEDQLITTRYDLTILENAARSIEAELEKLVRDLHIS